MLYLFTSIIVPGDYYYYPLDSMQIILNLINFLFYSTFIYFFIFSTFMISLSVQTSRFQLFTEIPIN